MLLELLQKDNLFSLLYRIDKDLAHKIKQAGCLHCQGPLHQSNYSRKPRGGPDDLPDEYLIRFSLCCGREDCRRRALPPSTRFMGRRAYWGCVILVVMTLRQNRPEGANFHKLKKLWGVSRETVNQWTAYFKDVFPASVRWKRIRGSVSSTVWDSELPGGLVRYCIANSPSPEKGLIACLCLLASG